MPIIDLQRRMVRTGAIRLGNMVTKTNRDGTPVIRNGKPVQYPNKISTFRVTSPHRDLIEAAARCYGGQVAPWHGPKGPEWEVVTDQTSLPVLVPSQQIDTNYELWGNKVRTRLCDGQTERLRKNTTCLCQQWGDHAHKFNDAGKCKFCGIDRDWSGEPHTHKYDLGVCVICGARRLCKPTTRFNVMLQQVPSIGVFKVESHGFTAASELPALSEMIASAPMPLPATVRMRFEDRPYFDPKTDKVETRQFWVPELHFSFAAPEVLWYGSGRQLEQASRDAVTAGPVLQALTGPIKVESAAPEQGEPEISDKMTVQDVLLAAMAARQHKTIQTLWKAAYRSGVLDRSLSKALTARAAELAAANDQQDQQDEQAETVEGDIVD